MAAAVATGSRRRPRTEPLIIHRLSAAITASTTKHSIAPMPLFSSIRAGLLTSTVWTASISQMVENQNQANLDKVQRRLETGVAKALRSLPDA